MESLNLELTLSMGGHQTCHGDERAHARVQEEAAVAVQHASKGEPAMATKQSMEDVNTWWETDKRVWVVMMRNSEGCDQVLEEEELDLTLRLWWLIAIELLLEGVVPPIRK